MIRLKNNKHDWKSFTTLKHAQAYYFGYGERSFSKYIYVVKLHPGRGHTLTCVMAYHFKTAKELMSVKLRRVT